MIQATMTRGTALQILRRHNGGVAAGLELYEQARATVCRGYDRPTRRVPALKARERERVNAVLLLNLGRAIGRAG